MWRRSFLVWLAAPAVQAWEGSTPQPLRSAFAAGDAALAVRLTRQRVAYRLRTDVRTARQPDAVWAERFGDCAEQARLLVWSALAAGVNSDRLRYVHCTIHGAETHLAVLMDGGVLDPTQMEGVYPLARRTDLQNPVLRLVMT